MRVSSEKLRAQSHLSLRVGAPSAAELEGLRPGHVLVGLLNPLSRPEGAQALAAAGVTAVSLDCLPRTLSRAQSMDVTVVQICFRDADAAAEGWECWNAAAEAAFPEKAIAEGRVVRSGDAFKLSSGKIPYVLARDTRPEWPAEVQQ